MRRTVLTVVATVAMALAAIGLAVAAPGRDEAPDASVKAAAGAVRITNSRDGQALIAAGGLRPGASVSGTVRIGNDGDAAGRFAVRPTALTDTPGPYGGVMSRWARLELRELTGARTLYSGAASGLGQLDLGTFVPGERRDYSVAVTLPDGDNRYQGSAFSLGMEWVAAPVEDEEPPAQTPAPPEPGKPPGTKPPTTGGGTPPAADPTGEALGDVLGLPSASRCVSRRKFKIRLRAPNGARVVSAVIRVGRKKPVRVSGGRTRAPVNLRGLPKGKVKVRLSVSASNGRTYNSTRTYRTCAAKKKPKKRKRS